MGLSRRGFFKTLGVVGAGACAGTAQASANMARRAEDDMGVLVDLTKCIGCRRCEYACQDAADFNPPPVDTFEDKSVMETPRRPHPRSHTVINKYDLPSQPGPVYAKLNCMHCIHPACMSSCLVSAYSKREDGAVTYDPGRCMGCRYCMVACPFEIPTYEYDDALTPEVRKCNLCAHLAPSKQEVPACVKICPEEVMTYGRRADLLQIAHERIAAYPDRYVDHVYGEHEAGGASWLYLSAAPFAEIGFPTVGEKAPPELTETVQHGVFKHFLPPVMLYGLLGAAMWLTRGNADDENPEAGEMPGEGVQS